MKRIKGLDGVRGFAALGVIAFHVAVLGGYTGGGYNLFVRTIGRMDCLVRLFYMISSVSLMYASFEKFENGTFNIEEFWSKRIKRIFPPFFLVMITHCIINKYSGNPNNIFEIIGTGSMLFALFPSNQDSIVWAGWSMGIQMIFYLFFPTYLVAVKNKKRACITFAISILLLAAYKKYYGVGVINSHINIIRQFIYFAAGSLIYNYKNNFDQLIYKKKLLISILCMVLEIVSFILFPRIDEDISMVIAFSALIVLQIMGSDYFMNNKLFVNLGKISYEMYLLHCVVYRLGAAFGLKDKLLLSYNICNEYPYVCYLVHWAIIVILTIVLSYILNTLLKKANAIIIQTN